MTSVPADSVLNLDDQDDQSLARMVASGSPEALETLYNRYSRAVMSFGTRMLGDRQSGEELVQEVFLKAWRLSHTYSADRGSYITWLLSITHNLAIDEIRKRNRRPQRADSTDPVLLLLNQSDQSLGTEASAELNELRTIMVGAINSLPEAQRLAVELAFYRGLTQREIAAELQEPLGTIKTRIRLGMRKLRDVLETHEVAPS
jgi:RNA polymerase sigma-70 factor (ECF subfamily)